MKKVATKIVFLSALSVMTGLLLTFVYGIKIKADSNLSGKIVLQIEENGEAWYINPENNERYYLGRPIDALAVMKKLSVGISNQDLSKISIEFINLAGFDSDLDGLADAFEDAVGTDKGDEDTDKDGYSDFIEIFYGYNPNGGGKIIFDKEFSAKHQGKIFLQAEQNGEAWYVFPANSKRYYLGRPANAFNIMRTLGLGISNKDLEKIKINTDFTGVPAYGNKEDEINEEALAEETNEAELAEEEQTEELNEINGIAQCKNNDGRCLNARYETCGKAVIVYNIGGYLNYQIEVLGTEAGLCKVKMKFNNPPVAEWENQEIVCLLSEADDLNIFSGDKNCSGDLYDILKGSR